MKSLVSAIILCSAIGLGTALAQTSAPAPAGQSATSHGSAEQKSAISKSCSDQANAKGLHGKARRKFRSACKRAGGKAE
jgi:psiF repeat